MAGRDLTVGTWRVIENAGYVGENDIGGEFASSSEAWRHVRAHYDPDEIEALHLDVGYVVDEGQGPFVTYEFS